MAIGLRGVGALATTTTNSLTITLPSGGSAPQSGDLIILHLGAGQDSPAPAYSSGLTGYAQRGSTLFLDYGPGGITQWIYWKIAGASESNPSVTINDGSDGLWGYAVVFSGVSSASPFDLAAVSQGTNTSSATFTPPNVTTQTPNAWVVSFAQTSDDNTIGMSVTQSFTNIASGASYETTVGLDASFGCAYKAIASPGSVTMPTWNQVNRSPDYWAYQTVGLTPDGPITKTGSFTTNAIKKANSGTKTFTTNAIKKANSGEKTFTVDASFVKTVPQSFGVDATLFGTVEDSFSADAIIMATSETQTFTTDAIVEANSGELTFTTDAWVLGNVQDFFLADAVILGPKTGITTLDAVILAVSSGSFTTDASVFGTVAHAFTIDARVGGGAIEDSFTVDAYVSAIGPCVWVSPDNFAGMTSNATLVWLMPTAPGNMHFQIELDTDSGFPAPTVVQSPGTGWEYWDGGGWQAIPDGGVPNTYAGNEARYAIQSPLSQGTWYRRVRAGVIS